MMGASPYASRDDLLRRLITRQEREFDEPTKALFAKGIEAEASIRPHVEASFFGGEELFPAVISAEVDGIPMLASMDGLLMDGSAGFEHKLLNQLDAEHLKLHGKPPAHHIWQLEHQLLVSGAERVLYVLSDGTPEHMLTCEYRSNPNLRAALVEGWKNLKRDLEDPETTKRLSAVAVEPEVEAPSALPVVSVRVEGRVLSTNVKEWRAAALAAIRSIDLEPKTDEEFAKAEAAVGWCKELEGKLQTAREAVLSQVPDLATIFMAFDEIASECRSVRLKLDKEVRARKEAIKIEIIKRSVERLRARFGEDTPNEVSIRIAEAIKGRRTLSGAEQAAAEAVARLEAELAASLASTQAKGKARTLSLGQINGRIAPLYVSEQGLEALGFKRIESKKGGWFVKADEFPAIVDRLISRLEEAKATFLGGK
jgi:predicted phage-related endonuclease